MTVEETLRAMLDGWTEDQWVQGKAREGNRLCVLARVGRVTPTGKSILPVRTVLDNVAVSAWPDRHREMSDQARSAQFNDHPDTTFADVVALVEKAAAVAGERGL